MIQDLNQTSNKVFRSLRNGGFITDEEQKYFSFDHKRACKLGQLYFLNKIHKMLFHVPGHPVISDCGPPTEKASEFSDSHLKTIAQESCSYIKDSGDFMNKMSQIGAIPENSILVTADIFCLYPGIPYKAQLKCFKKEREKKKSLLKINTANFVFKTTFLNLMVLLNNKIQERPLVECVLPLPPVYLWMR